MEGNLANELYGESLRVSKADSVSVSAPSGVDESELVEDGSFWGGSDEELDRASELEREWERRRERFHNIGYRDGIIAGKEAAAQEGFNVGFKQSVIPGYNWGLVRGITSALTFLPGGLREKLIEKEEIRDEVEKLHAAVYSLSTEESLKVYHTGVMKKQNAGQNGEAEGSPRIAGFVEQSSLETYVGELQSLLLESPAIDVKFTEEKLPVT